jgi:transposase
MSDYHLTDEQLLELRATHWRPRDKREADRIKAAVLLAIGLTAEQVAEVLQIDANTVRNQFRRYQQSGIEALLSAAYRGSACELTESQLAVLETHLNGHVYLTCKGVANWVEDAFGVCYTESGMTALLHRRGYVDKKPKLIPGKADADAQKAFLADDEQLKQTAGDAGPVYFMDAVHPQHNPVIAYGWIKRGQAQAVRSNTGRQRLNINGAINLEQLEPVVRYDDTIDATSTITLLTQLEQRHPAATAIHVICDNARYYRAKAVRAYLQTARTKLVFLPAYAPNLNLIERFWKFFKKQVLYNRYFETFNDFKAACEAFFGNPSQYRSQLRSLLTVNFAIIGE